MNEPLFPKWSRIEIQVDDEVATLLEQHRKYNESYSDTIKRLFREKLADELVRSIIANQNKDND